MKKISSIFLFLFAAHCIDAQESSIEDSLRKIIAQQKSDTAEVKALNALASFQNNADSAFATIEKAITLAQKLNERKLEAECYITKGMVAYLKIKDISTTIQSLINALNLFKELNLVSDIIAVHGGLQGTYRDLGDYRNALSHAFEGLRLAKSHNITKGTLFMEGRKINSALSAEISQTYVLMNQLDSAKIYAERSIDGKDIINGAQWNFPVYLMATIQNLLGNHRVALDEYRQAIPLAVQNKFFHDTLQIFSGMATAFRNLGQLDSSIHYASLVEKSNNPDMEIKVYLEAVSNLAASYKLLGNKDSALKYLELNYAYRDSVLGKEKERAIQVITFNEKLKQLEIITEQEKYKSRIQIYFLVAGLFVLLLITAILWRNNKQKQKAKNKIEVAYAELKTTQAQLIQSEKMASLGELTAGIAHEIQNPLNFVNNFSEINKELIEELKMQNVKFKNEEFEELLNDLATNEEKINYHGKRADAIVKGMLQHSRKSEGQKEPTDINALCDEYLRLAYHGLRAKDKSFNAKFETNFDDSIEKIKVVPQDIGRVILNLINNAFYAVNEKAKQNIPGYEPIVIVKTSKIPASELVPNSLREGGGAEISVADNGNGIPDTIKEKIFQPFFTTKPTGQGTGLGLSLAYDIVKAHGGEMRVNTREGEGVEFIIQLGNS